MNGEIEEIDSNKMEVLAEFIGIGVSDANNGGNTETIPYRIGVLGSDVIIASQSSIAQKPQGKVIPENANERMRAVFEEGIRRDWWSGDLVFGLENFAAILERLEEIFDLREARKIDLNEFEIENGKDSMGVRMNSIMPHNTGKPIVTVQITNHRPVNLDGVAKDDWHLYLSPETGNKLMKEMQRLEPLIRSKLIRH